MRSRRIRLLAAAVIVLAAPFSVRSARAEASEQRLCTTEEWLYLANALADYCVSQGYAGARLDDCGLIIGGDGSITPFGTGVCLLDE